MNLDFILFTPPKGKYSFVDFWGQVIFVPKINKKQKEQGGLSAFLNCYQTSTVNEVHLTVDAALLQVKGALQMDAELSTQSSNAQESVIQRYIPCLYLNSMVRSRYLLLYFHASGEDIKLAHKFLDFVRNLYQINVIAMEYSGYSIYHGETSSERIKQDSMYLYSYIVNTLGFKEENIIVMGRSIGTGVALELMQKVKPGALVLVSAFTSIKSLARQKVGFFGHLLARETYDNRTNIMSVSCPTFFVHGLKDQTISVENTRQLAKLCYQRHEVFYPVKMSHSGFDFYSDIADPLREFLMRNKFNFYEGNQGGPVISDELFKWPEKMKF